MDVIALMGKMLSEPGNVAIILHNNINDIPIRIQAKINTR
jgi:hypothetical protein